MAFTRPTLPELVDRIQSDFVSRLSLTGAVLRRSMVFVLSRVLAGAVNMLHGHLDYASKQPFADTADETNLLRLGSIYNIERNSAAYAQGDVVITGTNATIIPAETVLVRSDGTEYMTDSEGTIALGTVTVPVTASVAEEDGNCDDGVILSFSSPIAGADAEVTVDTEGLSGGSDVEEIEDYRARVLARLRSPPHGGNAEDFEAWALEVSGVTRAWVYPLELGAGTVTIRPVRDDDAGSIIPSAGEIADIQAYIDSKAPVTAVVTVVAPTTTSQAFTVDNLIPDNSTTRAAVTAEIQDILNTVEPGGTLVWSQLHDAIGSAAGVTDFTLASPVVDVNYTTGQLPLLGTISWT